MNGEPQDKAEVEAVQVARGGATDITPHSARQLPDEDVSHSAQDAVEGAWHGVFGQHSQSHGASYLLETPQAAAPPQAREAFAEALGTGALTHRAEATLAAEKARVKEAWVTALGQEDEDDLPQRLAQQALGFPTAQASAPPVEDMMQQATGWRSMQDDAIGSQEDESPEDAMEVAMAAQQALPTDSAAPAWKHHSGPSDKRAATTQWQHSADPDRSAEEAVAAILQRNAEVVGARPQDPLLKHTQREQREAKLKQAKLKQAKLKQAKLKQAKLKQAKLKQAKLKQAKLKQAKMEAAKQAKMEAAIRRPVKVETAPAATPMGADDAGDASAGRPQQAAKAVETSGDASATLLERSSHNGKDEEPAAAKADRGSLWTSLLSAPSWCWSHVMAVFSDL